MVLQLGLYIRYGFSDDMQHWVCSEDECQGAKPKDETHACNDDDPEEKESRHPTIAPFAIMEYANSLYTILYTYVCKKNIIQSIIKHS